MDSFPRPSVSRHGMDSTQGIHDCLRAVEVPADVTLRRALDPGKSTSGDRLGQGHAFEVGYVKGWRQGDEWSNLVVNLAEARGFAAASPVPTATPSPQGPMLLFLVPRGSHRSGQCPLTKQNMSYTCHFKFSHNTLKNGKGIDFNHAFI